MTIENEMFCFICSKMKYEKHFVAQICSLVMFCIQGIDAMTPYSQPLIFCQRQIFSHGVTLTTTKFIDFYLHCILTIVFATV